MSNKLFVGNLSFNTTENDLHDAFAAHGSVVEANIMMDRMSGRSRGFAFVTMSTPEEAQKLAAEKRTKAALREQRRKEQEANVESKKGKRRRGGKPFVSVAPPHVSSPY